MSEESFRALSPNELAKASTLFNELKNFRLRISNDEKISEDLLDKTFEMVNQFFINPEKISFTQFFLM